VKKIGGFAAADTLPEKGTPFKVCPDLADAATEAKDEELLFAKAQECVLFVDDDPIMAELGKAMLEHLGYRVTVTRSSLEALELMRKNPGGFDLLLTDQSMPEMTGLELVRTIRQEGSDIPVIFCSGYSDFINETLVRTLKISEFVLKPINISTLSQVFRRVLDNSENPE